MLRLFRAPGSSGSKKAGGSSFEVVFLGDTSLGDWYLERAGQPLLDRLHSDPTSFFDKVKHLLSGSDVRIANLETVLYERPTSPLEGKKNYLGWDSPKRTIAALQQLKIDSVSLANNHTMDFGEEVLRATVEELQHAKIGYFGAGKDLASASEPWTLTARVGKAEKRIHIIGALKYSTILRDYGFYATDTRWGTRPASAGVLLEQIRNLRAREPEALIILFPHWGKNYEWASENMWKRSVQFVEAGVDLILGHGAHMMQELATYPSGVCVFSIGNFVFNSRGRYAKFSVPPYSAVARLGLSHMNGEWGVTLRLYPIVSDNTLTDYTPRPVSESEAGQIYTILHKKSNDPDSFVRDFALAEDSLGWHIVMRRPLNTRFPGAPVINGQIRTSTRRVPSSAESMDDRKDAPTTTPPVRRVKPDADRYGEASTQAFYARALAQRGIAYEETEILLRGSLRPAIKFQLGSAHYFISAARIFHANEDGTVGPRPDADAAAIVRRKDIANSILRANGFPAPEGVVFRPRDTALALRYFDALRPRFLDGFCIKPANGGLGKQVHVGITDRDAFQHAFKSVADTYDRILVEKMIRGTAYRFLWIDGRVSAIFLIRPMNVVGDGVSPITELLRRKNEARAQNPTLRPYPLRLEDEQIEFLKRLGYTPSSVPAKDQIVYLSDVSNRHAGADTIDMTDAIHETYKESIARAISVIPGMLVCGADIVIRDYRVPAAADNYGIIELNTGPALAGHQHPWIGTPRDVAGEVIDALLSRHT